MITCDYVHKHLGEHLHYGIEDWWSTPFFFHHAISGFMFSLFHDSRKKSVSFFLKKSVYL